MHLTNGILNHSGLKYFHFNNNIENNLINGFFEGDSAHVVGNPALLESTLNLGGLGFAHTFMATPPIPLPQSQGQASK